MDLTYLPPQTAGPFFSYLLLGISVMILLSMSLNNNVIFFFWGGHEQVDVYNGLCIEIYFNILCWKRIVSNECTLLPMPSVLDRALFRSHPVLPSQNHLQKGMFQDMVTKATSKFALWPAISSIRFLLCMKVAVAGCLRFFCVSSSSSSRWRSSPHTLLPLPRIASRGQACSFP